MPTALPMPARQASSSDYAMIVKVKLDALVSRLRRIHEALGDIPLAGLELKCDSCGTSITSAGSRLVVDSVIELEAVIEELINARHAAPSLQRSA